MVEIDQYEGCTIDLTINDKNVTIIFVENWMKYCDACDACVLNKTMGNKLVRNIGAIEYTNVQEKAGMVWQLWLMK